MRIPASFVSALVFALLAAGCASPDEGSDDAPRLALRASTLAVGHLDMDAWLDLALAGPEGVDVRRGTGPASWAEPARLCACRATAIAIGDLDKDGRGDIVVVDGGAGEMRLWWGDEAGFTEAPLPPGPASPPLALVDVDNDGLLDIVRGRMWHRGAGERAFEEMRRLVELPDPPLAFVLLDDDKLLDLVVATGPTVRTLLHDPAANGTFLPPDAGVDAGVGEVASLAPADVDGDQRVDVVVAGPKGVRVLRNDGGSLVADASYPGEARGAAAADVDNDGALEIVAFDGRGAWIAGGERWTARGEWRAMAIADVDRSGALDVLLFAPDADAALLGAPAARGHHLTIRPLGNESNAEGVGLKATLATGTRLLLQQVGGAASPSLALPNEAHFGLGPEPAASYNLALLWPSGILQFDKADAALVVDRRIDARESTSEAPWDTC